MTDWILRGGTVVDGTGAPRFRADVAIAGDRIAAIGNISKTQGAREIDFTRVKQFLATWSPSVGAPPRP